MKNKNMQMACDRLYFFASVFAGRKKAETLWENGMEDERIIDLYWERSQQAIVWSEKKYGNYCGRIADNVLHNREDCEECLNDTWLRAWNSMPTERPKILQAFLGAITRNLSLDLYRRKHSAKRGGGETAYVFDEARDFSGSDEAWGRMERMELTENLNRFLAGLDKESRVMFVRRYWYMDSIAEIAARMGCGESRVKSCLMRLRKRLRRQLESEGIVL